MDPPRTPRPAVPGKRPAPHRRPPRRQGRARRRVRRDTPLQALCRFAGTFVLSLLVLIPLGLAVGGRLLPAAPPTGAAAADTPTPPPAPVTVDLSGLNSPHAILIRRGGEVLGSRDADAVLYPASLTKIMTVLLAAESLPDLDAPVTLEDGIFPPLWQANASLAGFAAGETVPVRDLLYGALLPSGAECSVTLACCAAGDEQTFVQRMNQRAAALGMQDTHFCNVTGLQDPAHVSTVRDIALLLDAALDNETFRQVFTARQYTTAATDAHPDGILLQSSMFAALDGESTGRAVLLGGKTGYTSEAGQCLASLAELDGQEYILVTAGAPGDHSTAPLHVQDAVTVYTRLSDACGG